MTVLRKHRPLSHPVVRRRLGVVPLSDGHWPEQLDLTRFTAGPGRLPPLSAVEQARISEQLDELAGRVRAIPDAPLTVQQRRLMRVIADELLRRSDVEPA